MQYRKLGNSGAIVSSQTLGTMTFGAEADEATSFQLMDDYVAAGGNFLDTADVYSAGTSEQIVGRWLKQRGARDRIVLGSTAREILNRACEWLIVRKGERHTYIELDDVVTSPESQVASHLPN